MKKRIIAMLLILTMSVGLLAACGKKESSETEKDRKIAIAYQYGMAFFPLIVMKEQGLIEKNLPGVEVEWVQLNSGAAIAEGLISGSLDFGGMGVGPMVINILKGASFKTVAALSSQPINLMSMKEGKVAIKDIGDAQIGTVNIGSIQHIALAMQAEYETGDAHAIDNNILAMSHPDGMTSLLSGNITYHLTNPPYTFREQDQNAYVVNDLHETWPVGTTFDVVVGSEKIHNDDPELYQAVYDALIEAQNFLVNNKREAAELLCVNEGVTADEVEVWLNNSSVQYIPETVNVINIAKFMYRAGFVTKDIEGLSDLCFDNVKGN